MPTWLMITIGFAATLGLVAVMVRCRRLEAASGWDDIRIRALMAQACLDDDDVHDHHRATHPQCAAEGEAP